MLWCRKPCCPSPLSTLQKVLRSSPSFVCLGHFVLTSSQSDIFFPTTRCDTRATCFFFCVFSFGCGLWRKLSPHLEITSPAVRFRNSGEEIYRCTTWCSVRCVLSFPESTVGRRAFKQKLCHLFLHFSPRYCWSWITGLGSSIGSTSACRAEGCGSGT